MSIPPLVCSTPPPPDQCEDDKDPEDFDLSYRLSQDEEEDDAYIYGSFSTYNSYQTSDKKDNNTSQPVRNEAKTEIDNCSKTAEQCQSGHSTVLEVDVIDENKFKCEEETNVEDLNLEVTAEALTSNKTEAENEESEIQEPGDSLKETPAESIASATHNSNNTESLCDDDPATDPLESDKETGSHCAKETEKEMIEDNIFDDDTDSKDITGPTIELDEIASPSKLEFSKQLEDPPIIPENPPEENIIDDDFGDFDDFQFASPVSKIANVGDTDSPWDSKDAEPSDFGNFTATFEENQIQVDTEKYGNSVARNDSIDNQVQQEAKDFEDDDFGDFDDFKSSAHEETAQEHSIPCQDVPVLNLQSNDSEQQIMESINDVLTSIFLEDMSEPTSNFEGKLESLLSETWGYLMATDERQPYIVNWNNSLGQKTLLKALCIDSRNILFGPKWNTNMPKYAANLSVAPLQPQKPLTPSNVSCEIADMSSKPATWADPFTSDGQKFTYAEALLLDLEHLMATLDQMAHNHSTLKISELLSHACNPESESRVASGPTDLDFEGAVQTKSEKIYPSTLSIQPLRQINLPDTHIFTPTDSETPRSKTIHYDSSPTVLIPEPVMPDNSKQAESTNNQNTTEMVANSIEDDSEYWEFQGFTSTSDSHKSANVVLEDPIPLDKCSTGTSDSTFQQSSVVFHTQPLEPIKMEPAMPTLNWPEPGEVKDVFGDFTDFVSTPPQIAERAGSMLDPPKLESSKTYDSGNFNDLNVKSEKTDSDKLGGDFDDDFDNFQSALPPTTSEFSSNSLGDLSNQIPTSRSLEFDYAFPKTSVKSETISFPSVPRPNEALSQTVGHNSNTTEIINKNSLPSETPPPTFVLQPTPVAFSGANVQNKQKTGQILQPLSLEGYSQINWPSPGIDLQDLSRFNPVETLQSLKSDLSVSGLSKGSSPVHSQKSNVNNHQTADDDMWGEFVSSKPKQTLQPKKPPVFVDDDEWTDFISSPSVKPQNGLNTISLNVHTSSNQKSAMQKLSMNTNQAPLDIPTLNYITPKSSNTKSYNDRHFQNL